MRRLERENVWVLYPAPFLLKVLFETKLGSYYYFISIKHIKNGRPNNEEGCLSPAWRKHRRNDQLGWPLALVKYARQCCYWSAWRCGACVGDRHRLHSCGASCCVNRLDRFCSGARCWTNCLRGRNYSDISLASSIHICRSYRWCWCLDLVVNPNDDNLGCALND